MKNKIVGILVCMLVIATAVPAVTSLKNNTINATVPSHPRASMAGIWTEGQKLLPGDGAADHWFGWSVSLDGDTALFGSDEYTSGNGSVYVFTRTGISWTQQAKLIASDGANSDEFGYAVSLDGNTALIGAMYDNDNGVHSGSAYVFTRTGTTWTQQQKLLPSDGVTDAQFGISVSLNGDTALIGANRDDDNGNRSGSAYVFTRTGTTWTQQAKLIASDGASEERFGIAIALEGDTALIGSETPDNGQYSGSVYVFTRIGTTWTEQQKLLASDGAAIDWFGFSIALDDDTALFAASQDDDNGANSGSAYVFTRTGTTWTQQAKLVASDGAAGDWFGNAVALSGNTAFIGACCDDDNGVDSGSAYVFTKTDLTFSIKGGLGVKAVIKNDGTTDANNIPWQIHVEGGMLGMINKTVNGTVDIPAGDTVTVKTGLLLGFGPFSIIAKVAGEEQTATGTQLIIFSIVKK